MNKGFRLITMIALSLVLLAGISLTGCAEEELPPIQDLDMQLYQYLKGATVDMDDATLNSMAEGGGEGGANSIFMGTGPAFQGQLPACKEYANLGTPEEGAVADFIYDMAYEAAIAAAYEAAYLAELETADWEDALEAAEAARDAAYDTAYDTAYDAAIDAGLTEARAEEKATTLAEYAGHTAFMTELETNWTDAVAACEAAGDAAAEADATIAAAEAAAEAAETQDLKEVVSAELVAFLGLVDAAIADADVTLQENPAYITLYELPGLSWFGSWSQGAWPAKNAFWASWPDPAGRGGECEFTDWVAANGLADATGNEDYTWEGVAGAKYAELDKDDRDAIDADLALFYATMATQADPGLVAASMMGALRPDHMMEALVVQGNPPEDISGPDAMMMLLGTKYPDELRAGFAASTDVGRQCEAWDVLCKELGTPQAAGWAADIEAGVHPRQAFFRWIARIAVGAMGAAGVLVELSVGEFSFKITNPNEYFVSVDNLSVNISVNSDGFGYYDAIDVDAAKLAVGDKMWIPEAKDGVDGEVIVKLSAPIKWYDVVTWLVMGGYDSTAAGTYASDVWKQIHLDGTAVFDVTVEATISSEEETITQSFDLTWTPA